MRAVQPIRRLPVVVTSGRRRAVAAVRRWPVWKLAEPLRGYVIAFPALALAASVTSSG